MRYRRVIITRRGGPEVLQIVEEDLPQPERGEVRVRILAAGVSYADLLMREGVHPETLRTPFTPGWDVVGVVDCVGDGVSGLEPGQMVAALPITGGYAEFICLPDLGEAKRAHEMLGRGTVTGKIVLLCGNSPSVPAA